MRKKITALIVAVAALIGIAMPAAALDIHARVSGVTATSCPDTRTVQISWEAVEDAESYQLQISRSRIDWSKVDSYTTTGTKYSATFNYKSAYRVVGMRYLLRPCPCNRQRQQHRLELPD